MKNITHKKYKTLFPDSMISNNKILYNKTSKNLKYFLKNNFSSNSSYNFKFPIKKSNISLFKKTSLKKRQSAIIKEKLSNPKKVNVRTLIESLRHENYKSYNYYDNTKGPLQSRNIKNTFKIINRQKENNNIYNNSVNETKPYNLNLLSWESRARSPINNFSKSNSSLSQINRQKIMKRNKKVFKKHNISKVNSFSFSNYIFQKKDSYFKNVSRPETPSSTRYKSKIKRNSLQLDHDSLSFSNSIKKNNRNRPRFSASSQIRNIYYLKNNDTGENYLNNRKLNLSDIRVERAQRRFHQQLYLNNLRSQIRLFEESNGLDINEAQIKSNLISQTKFKRNQFVKEMKRASNHNDFYFKKFPFQSEKFENLQNKQQKNRAQSLYHNIYDNKSKTLLKNIEKLYKKLNVSKNYIQNIDNRLRTNNIKRIIDFVVPFEHNIKDIDEQFKDETINYQRNIGKFFIYKGSGVYSGHLSSILRGDKIIKQTIKLENL